MWDCEAGSWDELVVELDNGADGGILSPKGSRLMIDMGPGDGPKLCMSGAGTRPQDSLCDGVDAIELEVAETADDKPPAIRRLAAFSYR